MGGMDSGNSGSMHSWSTGGGGGDEQEYESHGGGAGESSFPSNFFNNHNQAVNYQVAPFDNARLLQSYSLNNNNGSSSSLGIFDNQQQGQVNFGSLESANFNTNNTSNSNLDSMMWANRFGSIRSPSDDHATNCTTSTGGYHQLGPPVRPSPDNSPRSSNQNASVGGVSSSGVGGGLGRNPKKRSRASRRAPTTVLTTDTSNFRQMVQEFTGIPAPPFSASGFPSRSRLGGLGMGMGMGIGSEMANVTRTGGGGSSNSMDPPSYLLRPFAQKILPHPSPPPLNPQQPQQHRNCGTSTTTSTSTNINTNTNALTNAAASSSSGANAGAIPPAPFQLLPTLSFQSLLQQTSSALIHPGSNSSMDNLGSSRGAGGSGESEQRNWFGLHQGLGMTQEAAQGVGNMSVAAINSTSDNQGGGVIRGERGMVDSWICSSD